MSRIMARFYKDFVFLSYYNCRFLVKILKIWAEVFSDDADGFLEYDKNCFSG